MGPKIDLNLEGIATDAVHLARYSNAAVIINPMVIDKLMVINPMVINPMVIVKLMVSSNKLVS